jgi:DASH complex subunit Duo1
LNEQKEIWTQVALPRLALVYFLTVTQTVSRTVTSASTLLNTWTRILSQTEHNQRLILNPNWRGASQDLADIENEAVLKAQAAERRAAEEERRREEARRRAEDEERQRQAGTATRVRGARSRGRGVGRGGGVSSTGYVAAGGSNASLGVTRDVPQSTVRGGSGTGRGIVGMRGRGKIVR